MRVEGNPRFKLHPHHQFNTKGNIVRVMVILTFRRLYPDHCETLLAIGRSQGREAERKRINAEARRQVREMTARRQSNTDFLSV
jgi:hypothetical protein